MDENQHIYEWDPATKRWNQAAMMSERRSAFGISVVGLDSEIFQHCETGNRVTDMIANKTVAPDWVLLSKMKNGTDEEWNTVWKGMNQDD